MGQNIYANRGFGLYVTHAFGNVRIKEAHSMEPEQPLDEKTIITLRDLAERWGCETTTLRDPRFRRRLGLPLIRVGGRFIGAYERDVTAIEQRGRQLAEA